MSAFLIKLSGLAAFFIVYMKMYGTVEHFDTDHYFNDSKIIYSVAQWDFAEFVKLMFGFQDDAQDSELFSKFLRFTSVWDEDKEELLYNDNRLMLRFNALIHFISFNNYFVHALFGILLSFIGINWIYKTFKFLFPGKEIWLFAVWLVFPGLWFWSSALFKEGPALFCMGLLLISLKRVLAEKSYSLKNILMLLLSVILSFSFKQYVMLPLLFFSLVFFIIYFKTNIKLNKSLIYIFTLLVVFVGANITLEKVKGKSMVGVLAERQKVFLDMSTGGLFLLDSTRFIRLPYDTALIKTTKVINQIDRYVTIKQGAHFMYWEHSHQQDTLYCTNNTDTLSEYQLFYTVNKANATIRVKPLGNTMLSLLQSLPTMAYITIGKPFFVDARNMMDMMASLENLIILLAIALCLYFVMRLRRLDPWLVYFISIVGVVLIVIGETSPNIGAIQRYRVLVVPFLLMCTVLVMPLKAALLGGKFFKNRPNN